ncbi:hypothetical protein ACH0BO_07155 [Brevibacterium luteolum]|uniref:hypothetical protein n=1 Tax=Brevibacterium luteolum TaxID=199591 RepID=UPI003879044E
MHQRRRRCPLDKPGVGITPLAGFVPEITPVTVRPSQRTRIGSQLTHRINLQGDIFRRISARAGEESVKEEPESCHAAVIDVPVG